MADDLPTTMATAARPGRPCIAPGRAASPPHTRPGLQELVRQYQDRVARVCYRLLGWRQDIEDVVQDVFLVALRGLPDFRGDSRIETWLTRVAVNTCRSHLRRRALWLRVRAVLRCERQESAASPAEHDLARHERVGQVQRALRRLPARDREVLVLRYLEGLPVAELAAVLEVSHNAVEVRLSRARKRLKSELLGALDR